MIRESYSVLLVDDEALPRKLLENGLKEVPGVMVTGLPNGLSAKKYLLEHVVDIVITDIMMPFMNGLELAGFIKEFCPYCPTVIISGYGEFEYAKKAIQYGVKDYILKPVQLKNLAEIVEKCKDEVRLSRKELLEKRYCEHKELESALCRMFEKGVVSKNCHDDLDKLMSGHGTVVGIRQIEDLNGSREEMHLKYRNLLNGALPTQTIFYLGYIKGEYRYLILTKQNENPRMLKAVPEYLDRILEKQVEWKEIGAVSSAKELVDMADVSRAGESNVLIERACNYINEHLGEAISREQVAEYVHLSSSHFGYLFKQAMGIGYNTYVTEVRVNRAKKMLRKNMLVSDVAIAVGFHDAKYFSEIFYRKTGYLPSDYKTMTLNDGIPWEAEE